MAERASKTGIRVEDILTEDLYGIVLKARGESNPLPASRIQQDLWNAEDFYERDLQIRFNETRVFSDAQSRIGISDQVLNIGDFDETKDISESAYDYDPHMWAGENWGRVRLSWRPVRRLVQVVFTWPGWLTIWRVPDGRPGDSGNWLRLDRRFGFFDIIPTGGIATVSVYMTWYLNVRSGGRGVPQSIAVDYLTGFTPEVLQAQHQDLLRGVRLRTILSTLGILSAALIPGGATSDSLSMDGQGRSKGYGGRYGAYSGAIELAMLQEQEIRRAWKQEEKGVQFACA